MGIGDIFQIFVLSTQYCYKSKTALKNKVYFFFKKDLEMLVKAVIKTILVWSEDIN